MLIRGSTPDSCFGLAGCDENAGTAAFGWCLSQCPSLRREFLKALGLDPDLELVIASQVFAEDRGFTDLEVSSGTAIHVICEAKLGWRVPTLDQLERYVPRLHRSPAQHKRLVSISSASQQWAARHQPAELGGIPLSHLAWSDLQAAAQQAHDGARSPVERVWLWQLIQHLKGYGMTSNLFDAKAYVVSLNRSRISDTDPLT